MFLQLHFARPTAYNEIYNTQNKWDKDYQFYRAFDTDESFFSQRDYLTAKHRRALISNLFSKTAISELHYLIREKVRSIYLLCICQSPDWVASWMDSAMFSRSIMSLVSFSSQLIIVKIGMLSDMQASQAISI
jgi:hypothetical protein